MARCKACGKGFHACSSCGLTYDWEWNFCCETHWKESDEYKEVKEQFMTFYKTLSDEQKTSFAKLIERNDDYQCEMFNWMEEKETE